GQVNDWVSESAAHVLFPTISHDGLAFYFVASFDGDPSWHEYETSRRRPTLPFERPTALELGTHYAVVYAAPARSTLFVGIDNFPRAVLVRSRLDAPLELLEEIAGSRAVPVEGACRRLIATGSPGGCPTEEVFVLTSQSSDVGVH